MRLRKIWIKEYKQLKNFTVEFAKPDELTNPSSLRFFIGRNGSGKSAVLEALGLIFTRAMQDEAPGFDYEVIYSVMVNGKEQEVMLTNHNKSSDRRIDVRVQKPNDTRPVKECELLDSLFSLRENLHPKRIIASASGPMNLLDEVLIQSPVASLISDIADAMINSDNNMKIKEIELALQNLKKLKEDPRFLFFDGTKLKSVLVALCAILPEQSDMSSVHVQDYCQKRAWILQDLEGFQPVGFSLVVNESRLQQVLSSSSAINPNLRSFLRLLITKEETDRIGEEPPLHDWVGVQGKERIGYFEIQTYSTANGNYFHSPSLGQVFDPMQFLTVLLVAQREELLTEIHFAYQHQDIAPGENDVLGDTALSDGEFLWITRLGLVLLAQGAYEDNVLFFFDEPDVHLNETWTVKYVSMLHKITKETRVEVHEETNGRLSHDIIIATHSSMILTDADLDQLYLFKKEKKQTRREPVKISSFGASRDEISRQIFETTSSVGEFTQELLKESIEKEDYPQLDRIIERLGPGYLRFRLRSMSKQDRSKGGDSHSSPS